MLLKLCKSFFVFLLCACFLFFSSCTFIEKRMYPMEHKELIDKYSEENGIPSDLVAAVIYAESKYNPDAISSAGAMGLMQIMPATAEEIARRMGKRYDESLLCDPETNICYGTYYLAYLYRNLGENWDTACAAYNAGIGKVKGWLEDSAYSDDGETLKSIPIKETSDYVERINKYRIKYKELYYEEGE